MKYAIFTGAAGGLGGACAKAMAQKGWTVFAFDINDIALLKLKEEGFENIVPVKVDITNQESIDNAHAEISKITTSLDAIINFAGFHSMASMIEGDVSNLIQKMFMVNTMGMIRINRTFIDMIIKGKGRIINCSSECGYMKSQPFNGPYSISKYAVEAYNDSLRKELMFLGIKVIKIEPGSFKTQMHEQASDAFDKMINGTKHYKKVLSKMKPMMTVELKKRNDPKYLIAALIKAVESKRPKFCYRVKNSKLLTLLEFIPDTILEWGYKIILK